MGGAGEPKHRHRRGDRDAVGTRYLLQRGWEWDAGPGEPGAEAGWGKGGGGVQSREAGLTRRGPGDRDRRQTTGATAEWGSGRAEYK